MYKNIIVAGAGSNDGSTHELVTHPIDPFIKRNLPSPLATGE
jgi:hypothetical protein